MPRARSTLLLLACWPLAAVQEARFLAGTSRVVVPLRQQSFHMLGRALVVDLEVGGKTLPVVVDTGSAMTSMHPDVLQGMGLTPRGRTAIIGQTETGRAPVYKLAGAWLGGLERRWLSVIGLDPDHSGIYEEPVAGLLGASFFDKTPFTIDLERSCLTVYRSEAFEPPKGAVELTLGYSFGLPFTRARLDGGRRYRFDLDTGYTGVLQLNAPFVVRHGLLLERDDLPTGTLHGAFGTAKYSIGVISELRVQDYVCRDLPVDLSHPTEGTGLAANRVVAGTLGAGFFAFFRTTFDFPNRRLFLEPRAGFDGRFPPELGVQFIAGKDRIEVGEVIDGSPADRAGLRFGDVVSQVDGRPPPARPADLALRLLRSDSVRLRLQREDRVREATLVKRAYLPRLHLTGATGRR